MGAYSSYFPWLCFKREVQILTRKSYNTKNYAKIERLLFRNHQHWKYLGQVKPLTSVSPTPLVPAESKDNLEQIAQCLDQLNFECFQGFHVIYQSY